jgi:hypothetical protein
LSTTVGLPNSNVTELTQGADIVDSNAYIVQVPSAFSPLKTDDISNVELAANAP